jgi:hypothetical protein
MKNIILILNWVLISALVLLGSLSVLARYGQDLDGPITVIEGADGPTAVFIRETPIYLEILPYLILIAVLVLNILVIRKQKQ